MLGLCGSASAQIQFGEAQRGREFREHVVLLSDAQQVEADKPQTIELRFRVDDGFHINSHTPKDELLIPTELKMKPGSVIHVLGETYQKGTPFKLQIGDGEMLDVYQGEFRVTLQVVVPKGPSTLVGLLRYQACDNAACFPPKVIPVTVAVTGR
jgi:hypothetical protein